MEQYRFLVVEDSRNDLFFIERAFQGVAPQPILCRNVGEAKAYLVGGGIYADREKHPFPVAIISDLHLSADLGMDFLRWIRSNESTARLPFFFLTDAIAPHEKAEAESFKDVYVFQKPLEGKEFATLIITIIGRVVGQMA